MTNPLGRCSADEQEIGDRPELDRATNLAHFDTNHSKTTRSSCCEITVSSFYPETLRS